MSCPVELRFESGATYSVDVQVTQSGPQGSCQCDMATASPSTIHAKLTSCPPDGGK